MLLGKGEILGTPSSSPARKKSKNRGAPEISLPRPKEPSVSGGTDPQTGESREEDVLEISGGTETRRRRALANGNGYQGVPVARRTKLETSGDSLSPSVQCIPSSAGIGKEVPFWKRRDTAMANKGKASQGGRRRRRRNPGRIWGLAMFASVTLNLALLAVLMGPLYKGGEGLGSCPAGGGGIALEETKVAMDAAAPVPPMEQDKEDMAAGQDIDVSSTSGTRPVSWDSVIDLVHGDPTMFESFWKWMGERGAIVIPAWQTMSYFSDVTNVCWFLEPEFAKEVRRLHNLVGNAVTNDRYIIAGTGSTQLFQSALYALSPSNASEPINVVSAAPYYSSYPAVTDYLQSGLFRWAGDAYAYKGDKYIELVCSPNNPDGSIRAAVLNSDAGKTVHDLAYYWPQYTPISGPADHDIMLFTVSKSSGHAGTRLGWAIVKDRAVAKKMVKFIELNTIGVSKDSQLRAAKLLKVVSDGYELPNTENRNKFFDYGRRLMTMRWKKLQEAVKNSGIFSLPEFPTGTCKFTGESTGTNPAFAWLKCEKEGVEDCASFLRRHRILTRSGRHFGAEPKYVRVSMLDRDETFQLFIERLSSLN